MGNFTPISRWPAKCAVRAACVHSGALRAPLCLKEDVMAHLAGWRKIGVKFPMRAASVDPKNTQRTPLTMQDKCDHKRVAGQTCNLTMKLSLCPPYFREHHLEEGLRVAG